MERDSLRARRRALRLTPLEIARKAGCHVEVVLRAEFGVALPEGTELRQRLARAYDVTAEQYVRLALDAAEQDEERQDPG